MLKVVIDTNLLISALIGKSPTISALIQQLRETRYLLVTSEGILSELMRVVNRPKFLRYFKRDDVDELVTLILSRSEQVEPEVTLELCRDPKDNLLLSVAATARADFLVTGDKDLLDDALLKETMHNDHGVEILSAKDFVQRLSAVS